MSRARWTWAAFGLALALVLAAMGWVSLALLRADRGNREAGRRAAREETLRLALWRLDSALAPLVGSEGARAWHEYRPFFPAERAYNRLFAEIQPGEVLVPSPLLMGAGTHARLHFQLAPDGSLGSPQVPRGNMRDLAESGYTDHEAIDEAARLLERLDAFLDRQALAAALGPAPGIEPAAPQSQERLEYSARALVNRQTAETLNAANINAQRFAPVAASPASVSLRPLWLAGELLLVRRIAAGREELIQGCWLDWPGLRKNLLAAIADLLPAAVLEPVDGRPAAAEAGLLATLPVRLLCGPAPAAAADGPTPLQLSLLVAWVCTLLAAAGAALLLAGALNLSERRGAFVSAVTHELRTPLTTFRLYTDILAGGMITDGSKRYAYYQTLRDQAGRLGHLVENVLAYARLEKTGRPGRPAPIVLDALLERARGRLEERARQAGMALRLAAASAAPAAKVCADPDAVERILFNLVDNACKYAAGGVEKAVDVDIRIAARWLIIAVRDFGPGISSAEARRLFRPFARSAREAAGHAPGVGLGLALSRRLARGMRGELRLAAGDGPGSRFELLLPLADQGLAREFLLRPHGGAP